MIYISGGRDRPDLARAPCCAEHCNWQLLHRALPPNLRKVLYSMKTFTNANMFCLDPEKAGPAMIILPLMALEDQFGAEMKKLGIRF